jgi:mRNA-degrading endonuclease HigB of HigAB toxin-antitoxin module
MAAALMRRKTVVSKSFKKASPTQKSSLKALRKAMRKLKSQNPENIKSKVESYQLHTVSFTEEFNSNSSS